MNNILHTERRTRLGAQVRAMPFAHRRQWRARKRMMCLSEYIMMEDVRKIQISNTLSRMKVSSGSQPPGQKHNGNKRIAGDGEWAAHETCAWSRTGALSGTNILHLKAFNDLTRFTSHLQFMANIRWRGNSIYNCDHSIAGNMLLGLATPPKATAQQTVHITVFSIVPIKSSLRASIVNAIVAGGPMSCNWWKSDFKHFLIEWLLKIR